ncbi:MAG: hypothetical protein QOE70_124 [Chthoniobacter sp.]|jgi:hypothetical protein|nr:hypothetical protein [Chthoniobacter sp.]
MRRLALGFVILAAGCRPVPQKAGPLVQQAYVWQRVWTPEVRAAIELAQPMEGFGVLAAQGSLAEKKVTRPALNYAALKATGKPIALVIRVEPYSGLFREDDAATRTLVDAARERIAEWRRSGLEPAELQLDFDCADSKLDGYRVWLRVLRGAVQPLPVCPTTLPSWLKRPEFAALARESGRYVLQVHCVAPPRLLADTQRLTDPIRTAQWVEQAGRLGVPFRVALPTYAYVVAFDAQGKVRGVSAEGPSSRWPDDARVVRWEADPGELAQLIAQWTRARPAAMTGVIWYRLPVAGDALNWRWPTLAAVMQGRAPHRDLRVEASAAQPSEIIAINRGERDEPLPESLEASWSGTRFVAADALDGYALERTADDRLRFIRQSAASLSRLPPGGQRPIGWIRCENPTHIRLRPGDRAGADTAARADDGH